jgi:hypothetical protein
MKVLVATSQTQGMRRNDYCWAEEDELVYFGSECDREPVDGPCGCRRAMAGAKSKRATTTVKVVDLPIDEAEFAKLIRTALSRAGWIAPPTGEVSRTFNAALVEAMTRDLIDVAKRFPVGAIVERRGDLFRQRNISNKSIRKPA